MKSSSKRSIRGSDVILLLRLISLGILLNLLLHSPLLAAGDRSGAGASSSSSGDDGSEAKLTAIANPLVYTRLRHDDNYLQIYRNYQLEHTHKEEQLELRVNETFDDDGDGGRGKKTHEVVYSYYQNRKVDANLITKDDLILEALDRSYKSRLVPVYLYNYDDPGDKLRASDASVISEPKCRRDLAYLRAKLDNKVSDPIDPELAAFFDSYAKEETGLLFGNYHWTGNWRQCYKRQVFDKTTQMVTKFKGRYCVASLRSLRWEEKIKAKVEQLLSSGNHFKYPEQQYDYARFFRIQVGICLPESCDSRTLDTQRELIRELTVHKLSEPLKSYELRDLFCLPDETSELRQLSASAWLLILVASAWCSAISAATLYDWRATKSETTKTTGKPSVGQQANQTKTSLAKLVSALSLLRNYDRLTETRSLAPRPQVPSTGSEAGQQQVGKVAAESRRLAPNDLLFLNAFKVLSMPCILLGHTGMLLIMHNRFTLDFEALETRAFTHWNLSSVFFVDWYFCISGVLASYLTFVTRKVERSSPAQWLYTCFHRYWRLAPMYILLVWFAKSLFKHTGSGPVWDYGTQNMTIRSICQRESWLWPLAMVSNLHPIHEECIMPSWYIANDLQYYLITPFILVGLSKQPIATWLATLGLIGASVAARAVRYLTDKRAQPLELMRPRNDAYMRNNWDMHPTYIYPQYRISSYLIGLLAGHYVYMVLSGQWRSPLYKCPTTTKATKSGPGSGRADKIRWCLRTLVFAWGVQTLLSMMFASWVISDLFPRHLEPQVKYYTALIYANSHSNTALGLSAILVVLMFGHFRWLRRFLSHPAFTIISRINYFIFLCQVEVIYWLVQSAERVVDMSPRDAFKDFLTLAAICYPLSMVVTLWLELPLANLEREFIGSLMAAAASKGGKGGGGGGRSGAAGGGGGLKASGMIADDASSGGGTGKRLIAREDENNRRKRSSNIELTTTSTKNNTSTAAATGVGAPDDGESYGKRDSPVEVRID